MPNCHSLPPFCKQNSEIPIAADAGKPYGTKKAHSPEDDTKKGVSVTAETNDQRGPKLHKVWVPRSIEAATSEDNSDYTDRIMTALHYVSEITKNR